MFRIASALRPTVQLSCRAVGGIQVSSFATAAKTKKKRQLNKVGDMHAPVIIDELKLEDYLNPTKKGMVDSIKNKYYDWNSEYNIKKNIKTYKAQDMGGVVSEMLQRLQEFYAKDEISNASALITPPLMKQLQENHNQQFSVSQLKGIQKDLRYVGYSLSYMDSIPQLLQTRIIKTNNVLYGQVTFGFHCVEDVYGWTSRGMRVPLSSELPIKLIPFGGKELPIDSKKSEWKENEDSNHNKYYYNTITKVSSWTNPDSYINARRYCAYLCVIERPLLATMGSWRFQRI